MLKRNGVSGRQQQGFSLIEVLVAVGVLAFGLLAIGAFHAKLMSESSYSKARAEAIALAQEKLDEMRSYATGHDLVENLTNTTVDAPTLGNEFVYPDDVPATSTLYPSADTPEPIEGTNADFSRQWAVSRNGDLSTVVVTVSWSDRSGDQSVKLETDVAWRNPRGTVDVGEVATPLVESPTGKAYLGDGRLTETEMQDLPSSADNNDGTYTYDHDSDGDLELIVLNEDGSGEVALTLPDACQVDAGCTDFVKISGTVYFDRTGGSNLDGTDVFVLASDAAYCARWVPSSVSGTSLTTTTDLSTLAGSDGDVYRNNDATADFTGNENNQDDYEYFNYTCYLGGGWYGNVGLAMVGANSQDYACVGDPDAGALDAWKRVELAKRRVYRGMLHKYTLDGTGAHVEVTDGNGDVIYYTNGIRDAAVLPDSNWAARNYGHDFVISRGNNPTSADCDGVLSRDDADPDGTSDTVNLFHSIPGDFICLNADYDDSGTGAWANFEAYPWVYLNTFATATYDAGVDCPYDPSDPPSTRYTITGTIDFDTPPDVSETWGSTDPTLGTNDGTINTTDGFDNCTVTGISGDLMSYSCDYFVWQDLDGDETPWVGSVVVNSPGRTMCAPGNAAGYDVAALSWESISSFDAGITGTQTADFTCKDLTEFVISGTISVDAGNDLSATTMSIEADNEYGDGCQWTTSGADSREFSCNVMEQTYVSGYTGSVRVTIPEDYSCASDPTSGTAGVTTSCSADVPSVATWNFAALETASGGNNLLLDGPMDQITFSGTVKNGASSTVDSATFGGTQVVASPDATCITSLSGNTLSYTCTTVISDGSSWEGTVTITPTTDALMCGEGSVVEAVAVSGIVDGSTVPAVICSAVTEEPVYFEITVNNLGSQTAGTRYISFSALRRSL